MRKNDLMKKICVIALVCVLASLTACGPAPQQTGPDKSQGENDGSSSELEELDPIKISAKYFPDEFLRTVISDDFDTDGNGILSSEERRAASDLDVYGHRRKERNPSDKICRSLEGIEYFPCLTKIDIRENDIKELDLTACKSLTKVYCDSNPDLTVIKLDNPNLQSLNCSYCALDTLDLSSCEKLSYLQGGGNNFTEIDLSNNLELQNVSFICSGLTELDVSKNINLTQLGISQSSIEAIDVSANVNLETLNCGWTNIKTLDLSHNTKLTHLGIDDTAIETIDLSANPELNSFSCQSGRITKLDLSHNPELQYLNIQFLRLEELDISNCPKLIDIVEKGEKSAMGDRQSWRGTGDYEGQIQIPLDCKLKY